jgi:two-component system, OmpR family, sensor histidine kinase SenX3
MDTLRSRVLEPNQPTVRTARLRGDFLMLASHELLTPLTALKLQLAAMKRMSERGEAAAPAWAPPMLAACDRQIGRLAMLCDDLLQAIRLQAGDLSPAIEDVDVGALVREVVLGVASQSPIAAQTVAVAVDEGLVGRWDRHLMGRLLFHLVDNAVTFGQERPIAVEARAIAGGVRLTVRDQGIGIAAEDQERIFSCFERAVPVEHFGGLGLGLYLARAVARTLGGSIRVESELGRGATFIVEIPVAKEGGAR